MLGLAVRRSLQLSSAGVLGSGLGLGTYLYQTDHGTRRVIQAYETMVPVVLHYRFVEAKHKLQKRFSSLSSSEEMNDWKRLDQLYAVSTVAKLGDLQGMYVKYGQMAAGLTNTFGDDWIAEFRKLENEVPPRPVEDIYKTIEEETGKPVDEIFSSFDPIPLGSASIGQVHRAVLKSTGQKVAVKVQYADSQRLFRNDMKTIRTFCEYLAPEHIVVLGALEKQNVLELDYQNEAKNLIQVAKNMKRHNFQPREVVVPQPIEDLTTRRMLVMDLIEGPKLIDGIHSYFASWAESNGTTLKELQQKAREQVEREGISSKYSGPSASRVDAYRRYLRARDYICNAGIALYNSTFGWILTATSSTESPSYYLRYQHSILPPNTPRIIDTLMRVHGYQFFYDGFFNCDPNGGNFLLMPDGRIGLIDYGATKALDRNERLSACLLYVALARLDEQMIFDLCEVGGYKSKYGKKEILMKLTQFGYDSWGRDVTGGKNIQQFIDELKEEDPWEEVPDNLVMAQFMSIRLRSLALGMNHPIKCSDWWGPIAEEVLIKEGHPYETWDYEKMVQHRPSLNMQKYKFA